MLKKTIVILTVVMLLISCMVFPASAAGADWTIDYNDYIDELSINGDTGIVTVRLPREFYTIKLYEYFGNQVEGVDLWWGSRGKDLTVMLEQDVRYSVIFYSNPNSPFYLGNIPDGSTITVSASISQPNTSMYGTPLAMSYFNFWGENRAWVEQTSYADHMQSFGEVVTVSSTLSKERGDGTAYAAAFGIEFFNLEPLERAYYKFHFEDLLISFSVSALTADKIMNDQNQKMLSKISTELESQGKTLDSVLEQQQQTNDKLDQLPGQIGDEMQGVIDQEKQEAADVGDSSAGELIDIIPNHSEGFMSAIGGLVSSMSYNGTNATLTIPPITLPEIPGVMSEMPLTGELQADFGYWFDKIPSDIMELVRILCTIALIVYCFKELYGTISYALTLKGGGSDE